MSETLIKADRIGKIFCRDFKRSLFYGLQDSIGSTLPLFHRGQDADGSPALRKKEFWANKDISFELERGECLGLVGHNGAGKTTLLKMLNGLIKPDDGKIEMFGRVGAVIALGAGFNPLLTARENIFINGSVLGLSQKEIRQKFDEIIDFAEIHEFVDTPVQNFSSGMMVRLGFAVATSVQCDILLLDEVLAVGDANFRQKSLVRISKILKQAAVIFVSHNDNLVSRICNRALWLKRGRLVKMGDTMDILRDYREDITDESTTEQVDDGRFGKITVEVENAELRRGDRFALNVAIPCTEDVVLDCIQIGLIDVTGGGNAVAQGYVYQNISATAGQTIRFQFQIPKLYLKKGTYTVNFNLLADNRRFVILKWDSCARIEVDDDHITEAAYQPDAELNALEIG